MDKKSELPMECIKHLESDLIDSLREITNTKHHTESIQEAANIVAILDYIKKSLHDKESGESPSHAQYDISPSNINYLKLAETELSGAEEYIRYYEATGNKLFVHIAKQKAGEASALLTYAKASSKEMSEIKERLNNIEKKLE